MVQDTNRAEGATAMGRSERKQGRRLRALADAYHRTIKYGLRGVSPEEFGAYFPGEPERLLGAIYNAYKQSLHQARVFIESDFDSLCDENQLPDKLHALEEMCEAQGIADGDAAAAPAADDGQQRSLGPTRAARLCLLRAKRAEGESLAAVLAEVTAANEALASEVAERRRAAQELLDRSRPLAAELAGVHSASNAWASRTRLPVS